MWSGTILEVVWSSDEGSAVTAGGERSAFSWVSCLRWVWVDGGESVDWRVAAVLGGSRSALARATRVSMDRRVPWISADPGGSVLVLGADMVVKPEP
jgi:hypothetical protein